MRIIGKALLLACIISISFISLNAQKYHIVIDKPKFTLSVYEVGSNALVATYPVCLGTNLGQKQKVGDRKTPEGEFTVSMIQDASSWTHDFKDGGGVRKGAYGPWYFRLYTPPHTGIGIHGTCFPERIGTRDSEGCIRLKNEDLVQLKKYIQKGTKVKITPDFPNGEPVAQKTVGAKPQVKKGKAVTTTKAKQAPRTTAKQVRK